MVGQVVDSARASKVGSGSENPAHVPFTNPYALGQPEEGLHFSNLHNTTECANSHPALTHRCESPQTHQDVGEEGGR